MLPRELLRSLGHIILGYLPFIHHPAHTPLLVHTSTSPTHFIPSKSKSSHTMSYHQGDDTLSRTTSVSKRQGSTMSRNQSLVSGRGEPTELCSASSRSEDYVFRERSEQSHSREQCEQYLFLARTTSNDILREQSERCMISFSRSSNIRSRESTTTGL